MDDEPYVDYHEIFPTRWEITAAYAICCAACHKTKPAKYFRRFLTRAQAADRGYVGMDQTRLPRHLKGDRPMTVESKFCTTCQPGRYRPTQMTKDEVYDAAYNGRASLARANADVEKKRAKTRHQLRAALAVRWEVWRESPWLHIREKVSAELMYVQQSLSYYRNHAKQKEELGQLSEFLLELRAMLHVAAAKCAIDARAQRKVDETLTWRTLIGEDTTRRLTAMWEALPVQVRLRRRRTPAPVDAAVRNEPLFADYVPLGAPNKRKPEEPIPEERMTAIEEIIREQASKRNL